MGKVVFRVGKVKSFGLAIEDRAIIVRYHDAASCLYPFWDRFLAFQYRMHPQLCSAKCKVSAEFHNRYLLYELYSFSI